MSQPEQHVRTVQSRSALVLAAAFAWVVWFSWFFFTQTPQNPFSRVDLLADTPGYLLEKISPIEEDARGQSGWRYLPQRFDLLPVAGLILAGAWGLGHLSLRLMRLQFGDWRLSRTVFALGLGLSLWSLTTLLLGLCGLLQHWLFLSLAGAAVAAEIAWRFVDLSRQSRSETPPETPFFQRRFFAESILPPVCVLAVAPFLLAMLLGAMLPPNDFDVKEYHLEGPKEWFQQGEITFLPHNVYTSFPFLTEMLPLSAMVLRGDWYRGALAGQVVLMAFAPLAALGLVAAGRFVGRRAGWLAALIFLTTPWIYRISIIAYAEGGLTCYLLLALLAALDAHHEMQRQDRVPRGPILLCGLLAGSGMACKYPGLLSVVIPLGGAMVWLTYRTRPLIDGAGQTPFRRMIPAAVLFSAGVLVTFGPWAARNLAETGNPVYPLAYSVFGGRDWNAELNEKFKAGHRPPVELLKNPAQIMPDFVSHLADVAAKSDWQSPLLFAFAPLALLVVFERRVAGTRWAGRKWLVCGLGAYFAWLFVTWWSCTHRIDRFWLPLIPVVALLAGLGLESVYTLCDAVGRRFAGNLGAWICRCAAVAPVVIAVAFNLAFNTTWVAGYNQYLLDENVARQQVMTRSMALLNQRLPTGARVLLVGDAEVFDARFEYRYNTVFDQSLFQAWCGADPTSLHDAAIPLKPAAEIRAKLREEGITHVFVNWLELLRYRATYTYTDFVAPARFRALIELGILAPMRLDASERLVPLDGLDPSWQQELHRWAPELQLVYGGEPAMVAYELFEVGSDPGAAGSFNP
jgi:hypothetical protein